MGIVLRENGRFEVYADFILVNEYTNPRLQCVDIDTDFDKFVLKFVKNADQVTENTEYEDLNYQIRRVHHTWRNRIGFGTSKVLREKEKFEWVIHTRIANFFKLYT